ncbi:MAG: ComF family protein, partial [Clostridiales bacterium]|nr:ComF family protein [Clostridiales bacterium]
FKGFDFLVPVPMHPKKRRKRGFNQAEVMAREISGRSGIPLAPGMLLRVKDTPPMSGLGPRSRAKSIEGAFALNKKGFEIENKKICLADDIFTTGATLNECAKTLREGGAAEIRCATFAVAVKNFV